MNAGDNADKIADNKQYYKKHLLNNPSGYSVKGGTGIIKGVPSDQNNK